MTVRTTHVLKVPVIRQETDYECGNTSLAAVLQYWSKDYSVAQVGELANTRKVGTDHADLIAAAVATGARVVARSGGGASALNEVIELIGRGIPVLCGWWSMAPGGVDHDPSWTPDERMARDCGHYSVLCGYTPSTLMVMDPQEGMREYADEDWMRVWYDTDTDAYELVTTWYMAIDFAATIES